MLLFKASSHNKTRIFLLLLNSFQSKYTLFPFRTFLFFLVFSCSDVIRLCLFMLHSSFLHFFHDVEVRCTCCTLRRQQTGKDHMGKPIPCGEEPRSGDFKPNSIQFRSFQHLNARKGHDRISTPWIFHRRNQPCHRAFTIFLSDPSHFVPRITHAASSWGGC